MWLKKDRRYCLGSWEESVSYFQKGPFDQGCVDLKNIPDSTEVDNTNIVVGASLITGDTDEEVYTKRPQTKMKVVRLRGQ